jgi:xanthine dehydrogenase YagR molybdenum-binding subunit
MGRQQRDCRRLRRLPQAAGGGLPEGRVERRRRPFANDQVRSGSRSLPLGEVAGAQGLVAEDSIESGDFVKTWQQATFGAHFVEASTPRPARRA